MWAGCRAGPWIKDGEDENVKTLRSFECSCRCVDGRESNRSQVAKLTCWRPCWRSCSSAGGAVIAAPKEEHHRPRSVFVHKTFQPPAGDATRHHCTAAQLQAILQRRSKTRKIQTSSLALLSSRTWRPVQRVTTHKLRQPRATKDEQEPIKMVSTFVTSAGAPYGCKEYRRGGALIPPQQTSL